MTNTQPIPKHILPVIVLAQFAGTSLWFAGNAVMGNLQEVFQLEETAVGHITSAVQLGFILGTLVFALLTIPDRFAPARVFLVCALVGAASNLGVYYLAEGVWSLLGLRFLTGFFLAGIYPVGMKIAADWHGRSLGKALGFLVGALVLGTAFPHLLKSYLGAWPWSSILVATSLLAAVGGIFLFLLVPSGPYRKKSQRLELSASWRVFRKTDFRVAAFGYFGHMWELYAFWAFVPLLIRVYSDQQLDESFWCFVVIGIGGISCMIGGYLAERRGSAWVAFGALRSSGLFCLLSPLLFYLSTPLFLLAIVLWGMAVTADSPQFSTLVARSAPQEHIGTALTIVNSIGFAISVLSIQLLNSYQDWIPTPYLFLLLLPGPLFGFLYAYRKKGVRVSGEMRE